MACNLNFIVKSGELSRSQAVTFASTRGSAMAEGLRDVFVSRNSATTKHPI